MRTSLVVALLACGMPQPLPPDAGEVDAGHDAGPPVTVTMRYLTGKAFLMPICSVPEVCEVSTLDDGGLPRWHNVYTDAGCAFGANDAGVLIDCRNRCTPDAGNYIGAFNCCEWAEYTPNTGGLMCSWSPP